LCCGNGCADRRFGRTGNSIGGSLINAAKVAAMVDVAAVARCRLCRAFNNAGSAPHQIAGTMQAQGGGAIVNAASIANLIGPHRGSVCDKIRESAACLGLITTRMVAQTREQRGDPIIVATSLGRVVEPEEIAEMVVWLCSARESCVIGVACAVDGGWTVF
jgi:Enoyl-(Acyl carrier protein) reductase